MAIKDLQKLLKQVHDPNEYDLVAHDLNHPIHWYFKVENAMMKDLDIIQVRHTLLPRQAQTTW